MSPLATIVIYALAAGAVVDLWRNGSVFAPLRARIESVRLPDVLQELLACNYCLTFQAAVWLVVLLHLPASTASPGWAAVIEAPATFLAVGRLAWLLDGILPARLRHDRTPPL